MRQNRWIRALFIGVGLFGLIQLIPYGRPTQNPPVVQEPPWDSPQTRQFFFRVCKDCHSNQTEYPWYAWVAPISWLIARDVQEGRRHFNVSEWHRPQKDADEAAEEYRKGTMPPLLYRWMHPEVNLSAAERRKFLQGLEATFGSSSVEEHSTRVKSVK